MATTPDRDDDAAATTAHDIPVRPTVFIGIGGTGAQVLLRLRRRILAHRWNGTQLDAIDQFPIAGFLLIDTDQRPTVQSDIQPDDDPYLPLIRLDDTAIRPADFRPGLYQANIRNYPHLESWLPSGDLAHVDVSEGAGQIRAISRLLFFDQIDIIHNRVSELARQVTANVTRTRQLEKLGLAPESQVRAVVVAGLAGGTGSGMFIDMGLFLRAMTGPEFADVDAYLMLPSGFRRHGMRTLANGFAALAELEQAMVNPPFIEAWKSRQGSIFPVSQDQDRQRPYSQVYLFDTANLDGDRTDREDTIYDLMADSLFEDFGTSDFAASKRSARVNQVDSKNQLFMPGSIDGDENLRNVALTRRYSALGQATLVTSGALAVDAAVEVATRRMLASFFGVAGASAALSDRKAPAQDRDRFMRETLLLAGRAYDDFPDHLRPRPAAVSAFELVDRLLARESRAIDDQLADDIGNAFVGLKANYSDMKDWEAAARAIAARYKGDIIAQTAKSAILQKGVADQRAALARRWFSDQPDAQSGSLLSALFDWIDDRARGGIDFTLSLVEEVRLDLERGDGPIQQLERSAAQLKQTAEALHEQEFDVAISSMADAAKGGLFGRNDRIVERYLDNASKCLTNGLRFRLRAEAADQAALLLRETVRKLGRRVAAEDATERYDGLMGVLHRYRRDVRQLMDDARLAEDRIANQQQTKASGTSMVIDSGATEAPGKLVDQQAESWADAAFQSLGKCRALLPALQDNKEKLRILASLRDSARERLRPVEDRLPAISAVLAASPDSDQRLRSLMSWAMPWIERAQSSDFRPDTRHYRMIVATGDPDFRDAFAARLATLAPTGTGIEPQIAMMGSRHTLVCYCELSAFPIDFLAGARDAWKREYEAGLFGNAGADFPLHIDRDLLRFPPPIIPTQQEIDRLKAALDLLLQAALMRVVARNRGGWYEFNPATSGPANWIRIGTEAEVRRRGIHPQFQNAIAGRVQAITDSAGPTMLSALAILADQLADQAYRPRTEKTRLGGEILVHGFGHKVARQLATRLRTRRDQQQTGAPGRIATLEQALAATLQTWSEAMPGSGKDAPRLETDSEAPRRILMPDYLTEAAFEALLAPAAAAPPPPPLPDAQRWYVAEGSGYAGPFGCAELLPLLGSRLTAATLVCPVGGQAWVPAAAVPAIAAMLAPPPPPPPPPPR